MHRFHAIRTTCIESEAICFQDFDLPLKNHRQSAFARMSALRAGPRAGADFSRLAGPYLDDFTRYQVRPNDYIYCKEKKCAKRQMKV
jgi:hypothetical protein